MAIHAAYTVETPSTAPVFTPLNPSSAAAGNVSVYHKGGADIDLLVSTSSSAPTHNDANVALCIRLTPGDSIIGQTLAALCPGIAGQYLYAAVRRAHMGRPAELLVSTA